MVLIRADANETVGTGHVMRCLSVAEALREMGEEAVFVTADGNGRRLVEGHGFPCTVLGSDWRRMEGELDRLCRLLDGRGTGKLFVDSYQVTEAYLAKLREKARTVYLDDLNAFTYPVDMLVCCAAYWERFGLPERYPGTRLLLGPQYSPLRREFRDCKRKTVRDVAENLLLLSGGTDSPHSLYRIMEKLPLGDYKQVTVICGVFSGDYERMEQKYRAEGNVRILTAVPDLKNYMDRADFAVSAGGTTLCELCATGTPAVSFVIADNQLEGAGRYDADGLIECAGDMREDGTEDAVVRLLEKYRKDRTARAERSRKMQDYMDGRGALRIAEAVLAL